MLISRCRPCLREKCIRANPRGLSASVEVRRGHRPTARSLVFRAAREVGAELNRLAISLTEGRQLFWEAFMKLYYAPGACSMAAHIVLRETGHKFETEKVDLKDKRTSSGADYMRINPKGYVPALQLDNGNILTEVGTIIQYLADQKPDLALLPKVGTLDRYREMEWINFITAEIHKAFGPLWKPDTTEQTREAQKQLLAKRFDY